MAGRPWRASSVHGHAGAQQRGQVGHLDPHLRVQVPIGLDDRDRREKVRPDNVTERRSERQEEVAAAENREPGPGRGMAAKRLATIDPSRTKTVTLTIAEAQCGEDVRSAAKVAARGRPVPSERRS